MCNNIFFIALIYLLSTNSFAQNKVSALCQQGEWIKVTKIIERSKNPTRALADEDLPVCINRSLCDGQYNLFRLLVSLTDNGARHVKRICINQAIRRGNVKTLSFALEHGLDKGKIYQGENFLHSLARTSHKSFELASLFLKNTSSSSKDLATTFAIDSPSQITGLTPLGEAITHKNYETAKLFMAAGASLLNAILIHAHRGHEPSLLKPSDDHLELITSWFENNGYHSIREFVHTSSASPFHKKGVIQFLRHSLPVKKQNTLEKIGKEYELSLMEDLLFGESSSSPDEDSLSTKSDSTISSSEPMPPSQPKRRVCLDICDETPEKDYVDFATCHHKICKACAQATIVHKITDKSTTLSCPAHGCKEPLELDNLEHLGLKPLTILRLKVRRAEQELVLEPGFHHCQMPDCPGGNFKTFKYGKEKTRHFTCGVCGVIQCEKCGEFHPHIDCKNIRLKQNELYIEKQLKSNRIKKCPKCNVNIEKNDGCDHMTCKKCRYEFHWSTLKKYIK